MLNPISACREILPYQGSALPLSYGSIGRPYALRSQGNQRYFARIGNTSLVVLCAEPSRTERETEPLCGTFWAQWRSAVVPTRPEGE